jgi:hypothetical protein
MVRPTEDTPILKDRDGVLWMSVTVMERESQFRHNADAFGDVLVMGAGLGLLPFNLLQNPKVKSVTVLEKCGELFECWGELVGLSKWPGQERLTLVKADARECDTLLADIWPEIGDGALEEDMQTFRRNIAFKRMMCWGAEFAFIDWCRLQGLSFMGLSDAHVKQWSGQTGHYVWPGFHSDALRAGATAIFGSAFPSSSQP